VKGDTGLDVGDGGGSMSRVTEAFREMALSFYGCDGGNLASSVWTCGLEWGGGYEGDDIPESEINAWPLDAWELDARGNLYNLKYQYNQKLAWFFAYLLDWDVDRYRQEAAKHRLFCAGGTGFKMNAYPLSYKNRNTVVWSERIKQLTGFDDFDAYRTWCIEHRGEYFTQLARNYRPKIILCTGVSYANEFFAFFRCSTASIVKHEGFLVCPTQTGDTLVFVAPFFGGASGINSYAKMEALVADIRAYGTAYFGNHEWLVGYGL